MVPEWPQIMVANIAQWTYIPQPVTLTPVIRNFIFSYDAAHYHNIRLNVAITELSLLWNFASIVVYWQQ